MILGGTLKNQTTAPSLDVNQLHFPVCRAGVGVIGLSFLLSIWMLRCTKRNGDGLKLSTRVGCYLIIWSTFMIIAHTNITIVQNS